MIPSTTVKRFLRHMLIRAGLEGISLTHAGAFWRKAAGRGLIFTLHHVRPAAPQLTQANMLLTVTPAFLEQAIQTCLKAGLTPLALRDLPERLSDTRDRHTYVCFTLDDGYRDNERFAAPVFQKYAVPYTIFVTAGFVERTRSMWWETLEALLARERAVDFDFGDGLQRFRVDTAARKSFVFDRFAEFIEQSDEDEAVARIDAYARKCGLDPLSLVDDLTLDANDLARLVRDPLAQIGAHSMTHVNLKRVDDDRLKQEIAGSADAVERYIGVRPSTFAYPYGFASAVGAREIRAAEDAGFSLAVTNKPGMLQADCLNQPTNLNRVSLNGTYQRKRYVEALLTGIPFKLREAGGANLL